MTEHWAILRILDRALWVGADRWSFDPAAAHWFDSAEDATTRATRELGVTGWSRTWQLIRLEPKAA